MAWELGKMQDGNFRDAQALKAWLSLLTIPVALLLWIIYRALFLGDLKQISVVFEIIFSILITQAPPNSFHHNNLSGPGKPSIIQSASYSTNLMQTSWLILFVLSSF
jgi:hypothetical protein